MAEREKVVIGTTVHVTLSRDLKDKLDAMAVKDRRKYSDLVRLLIDEEWERRQKALQGNGAAA